VRGDNVYHLTLADGSVKRLTGGFRVVRTARFLPSGRLLCLWSQGKQFGMDVMDADGKNRETLSQGSAFYRTVAPSPDGRYPRGHADLRGERAALPAARGGAAPGREGAGGRDARGVVRTATHSPHWGR
jgi:hypothetical protein